jgi:hypothetical protein
MPEFQEIECAGCGTHFMGVLGDDIVCGDCKDRGDI